MTTYKTDKNGKPISIDMAAYLENQFADPTYALAYLREVLADGEMELFLAALGDIARVKGITQISKSTGLNRQNIYKMLSPDGNPSFKGILEVLNNLGYELRVNAAKTAIDDETVTYMHTYSGFTHSPMAAPEIRAYWTTDPSDDSLRRLGIADSQNDFTESVCFDSNRVSNLALAA